MTTLLDAMHSEGLQPSVGTLCAALTACVSLHHVQSIHARYVFLSSSSSSSSSSSRLAGTLVRTYCKCGAPAEAHRLLLDCRPLLAPALWNCVILGYARNGDAQAALQVYWTMPSQQRSNASHLAALKACATLLDDDQGEQQDNLRCLDSVRAVHSLAARHQEPGEPLDMYIASSLLDIYAKCGSMREAHQMFASIPKPDVVAWSSIIMGYAYSGQPCVALQLFEEMQTQGVKANAVTFVAALKACGGVPDLDRGRSIHLKAAAAGSVDALVASSLVDMYSKCGSLSEALCTFQSLPASCQTVVTWTSIILGHAENGENQVALHLYASMRRRGCTAAPNAVTYVAALKACAGLPSLEQGRAVHGHIRSAGLELEARVANTLVDMYAKCGSMEEAESVFGRMSKRSLVSWNSLMMGYSHQGDAARVMQLFDTLPVSPDGVTFLALLVACNHAGLVDTAARILDSMAPVFGVQPGPEHYACIRHIQLRASIHSMQQLTCSA